MKKLSVTFIHGQCAIDPSVVRFQPSCRAERDRLATAGEASRFRAFLHRLLLLGQFGFDPRNFIAILLSGHLNDGWRILDVTVHMGIEWYC